MGVLTKLWYFLLFVLIIVLFSYENVYDLYVKGYEFDFDKYLEDPQRYGGHKKQGFGKVINISKESFYFDVGDSNLKIFGSIEKAIYGETVVYLHYRKDGIIELIDYHNYNYNYFLYILSFFAAIIFIIIFFNEWKITPRGFKDA